MDINTPLFFLGLASLPEVTHLSSHGALLLLDRTFPHSREPEDENWDLVARERENLASLICEGRSNKASSYEFLFFLFKHEKKRRRILDQLEPVHIPK